MGAHSIRAASQKDGNSIFKDGFCDFFANFFQKIIFQGTFSHFSCSEWGTTIHGWIANFTLILKMASDLKNSESVRGCERIGLKSGEKHVFGRQNSAEAKLKKTFG